MEMKFNFNFQSLEKKIAKHFNVKKKSMNFPSKVKPDQTIDRGIPK